MMQKEGSFVASSQLVQACLFSAAAVVAAAAGPAASERW